MWNLTRAGRIGFTAAMPTYFATTTTTTTSTTMIVVRWVARR